MRIFDHVARWLSPDSKHGHLVKEIDRLMIENASLREHATALKKEFDDLSVAAVQLINAQNELIVVTNQLRQQNIMLKNAIETKAAAGGLN